jgi:hypothetical protein
MSHVSGNTRNAFSYEGDYERGSHGRIRWNATYRKDGSFYGMRNGQLEQMQDVLDDAADAVVKRAIEDKWTEPEDVRG